MKVIDLDAEFDAEELRELRAVMNIIGTAAGYGDGEAVGFEVWTKNDGSYRLVVAGPKAKVALSVEREVSKWAC